MADYRIGIDVGGTFTDLVLLGNGTVVTKKVRSTPDDFGRAVLGGLEEVLAGEGVTSDRLGEVIHGMTVVSNALIEKKGARTGLITTKGFRDVLEIARLTNPRRFDMSWDKPPPLVERSLRREVRERLTSSGEVFTPLHEEDVEEAVGELLRRGVSSIAVCFINAYVDPAHELAAERVIRRKAPHVALSLSSQVLPEIKEFERTSTTVINAYVKPVIERYITELEKGLREAGVGAPLLVMQSNGGIMTAPVAVERPIYTTESGPAAGVLGVLKLGQLIGEGNLISFDMGGTTAKAAIIQNGTLDFCSEFEIGGESTGGWRFVKGSGYLLRMPAIDISEVGSGGGSVAWTDAGGVLQVGPHSAGAEPGPICYDTGGTEPTITDANVLMGYFNPDFLVGGELDLNAAKARGIMEAKLARPLGLSLEETAYGIFTIANARMQRAVTAVTTERARNPAHYTMVAYGGCGPAHAVAMARQLGIKKVLIPPAPGVFSSFGLLFADMEHHYVRTYWRYVDRIDFADATERLREMETDARDTLRREGFSGDRVQLQFFAEMRYAGQGYELSIPMPGSSFNEGVARELVEGFGQEHQRSFGYQSPEPVQLFRLRLIARGIPTEPRVPSSIRLKERASPPSAPGRRPAYFGPQAGWQDATVVGRAGLQGQRLEGPVIIEEYDATTVVPPGATVSLDPWGNILVEL